MVTPPAIALFYPSLLAALATVPNYTIISDDNGIPHVVNTTVPEFTQAEIAQMKESAVQTTYQLYTRNNPTVGQEILTDKTDSVEKSFWNPKHPTRLITHGWQGNCDYDTCTLIRDAYLRRGDYNIILIDWRKAAGSISYPQVVTSVPLVARQVSSLLNFLQIKANLNPKNTALIGHSLGGHVVSLGARFADGMFAEIVALDPAKILYEDKGPGERVDKSDAILVQGIHTSKLGLDDAIGNADFYPNGGKNQPGCSPTDVLGYCAHMRAYMYYAESITNPTGFRAENVFMGGPVLDKNARGNYTLKTADKPPFALG